MTYSPTADHAPFGPPEWPVLAVGLVLGGAAGWWQGRAGQGRITTIFCEADGTLKSRASPLGLILIVGLLAGRSLRRGWLAGWLAGWLEASAAAWHINPLALADVFMVVVVGLVIMQRVETFTHVRRIRHGDLAAHKQAAA